MAIPVEVEARTARDHYPRYYAEKLWSWIPEVYRNEDFRAAKPGVLRALIEIIAEDAATARRSIDRLWDDALIDYADDWAVPYIGDLVATRVLNSLNRRGVRTDVARTVFYRRRAGTPVVLEMLIKDITGWGGTVSEAFRRLARTWHGLDDDPYAVPNGFFGTPKGGTVKLNLADIAEKLDGPFDSYAHVPDFRRLEGFRGRYNIPKLNIHLFRQKPVKLGFTTAVRIRDNCWTLDPSGRDVQLFANNQRGVQLPAHSERGKSDGWEPARASKMPAPMSCRMLNEAWFRLMPGAIPLAFGATLAPLADARIYGARKLLELVVRVTGAPPTAANFLALQAATVEATSAKLDYLTYALLLRTGLDLTTATALVPEQISAADLSAWDAPPLGSPLTVGVDAVVDPARGRVILRSNESLMPQTWHYGQFDHVGAGGHERRSRVSANGTPIASAQADRGPIVLAPLAATGVFTFQDSRSYTMAATGIANVETLNLQANDFQRPYVRLVLPDGDDEFVISAKPQNAALGADDPANRRTLILEGLWLGIDNATPHTQALVNAPDPVAPVPRSLVLDGNFHRVELSNVSIDPGGERARGAPLMASVIPAVSIIVRGQVDQLVIDRSIVGAIIEERAAADPCSVGKVIIRDSIVLNAVPNTPAIDLPIGRLAIERSTVFGDVEVNRIDANETLVQGRVTVTDNQSGCFRFSAAASDGPYRLPKQFESHLYPGGIPNGFFVSRRFGDAGLAQLSDDAPRALRRGGENTSEIGVFNRTLAPILADDLRLKFEEYAPLNLVSQFIFET
ncbi:hypothetical protein [Mesorhizobium sp. IMUNJ 23232]|uniref:hypothetical protein n=1 Tax=Mesorhizobium sp. IMUNJ 23232 TaxID=3376064 RepID=UPI00379A4C40